MAERASIKTFKVEKPIVRFGDQARLTRYVRSIQRLTKRRAAPDAFMKNPGETHLSVNLLGIESLADIAAHYRRQFQDDAGRVAVIVQNVREYNRACDEAGLKLRRGSDGFEWDDGGSTVPAYRLRPTDKSSSHSGVEYVRGFDDFADFKFANRLAKNQFKWR